MRRAFIYIATVIVLFGIAVGAYFLFFANKGPSLSVGNPFGNIGSGSATPGAGLPNSDQTLSGAGTQLGPRFVKIADGPIVPNDAVMDVLIPTGTSAVTTVSTTTAATTTSTSTTATTKTTATTAAVQQGTPDTEVRFIDRASGNIYSYMVHARTLTRINNKTLPGIQVASWVAGGSRAYVQLLSTTNGTDQVDTYALDATGGSGFLLEQGLAQANVAGSSTLFTLLTGTTGSVGSLARADGSNAKTLFSSLISSLVVSPTAGPLFATNKPSVGVDGYGFQIDRASGAFTRILGPLRGLTVLPNPSGSLLMYSYTSGGSYYLSLLDPATRTTTALPVATFTEKCVWSANGKTAYCAVPTSIGQKEPDLWYQGAATFTDRIWKIDMTARLASLVLDPSAVGNVSVDAVGLSIDPNEDVLTFTDKHTGALYAYDL
jgi:hypothetical protein